MVLCTASSPFVAMSTDLKANSDESFASSDTFVIACAMSVIDADADTILRVWLPLSTASAVTIFFVRVVSIITSADVSLIPITRERSASIA